MSDLGKYYPIVKSKEFCPNPVARYGIPAYANSKRNRKVKNTPQWREWWSEQFRRCYFGYTTGGIEIPGRYYYYLNFCYMVTVGKGRHHPLYVDLDLEFFRLVEYAKDSNQGLISIKARRKGLSFKVAGGIFDYGFRFSRGDKYEAGICAGLDEHSHDFLTKFEEINNFKDPELQLHLIKDTSDKKIAGYEEKTDDGRWVKGGSFNSIYCETMFNNPNKFKGKKLEDTVFEESGEFDLLLECYQATKPCFMDGNRMVGTPYIYGTGGNIKSSSKGFKDMWHNAESFQLLKFEVPAPRLYFPCVSGCIDEKGNNIEDIPYLKEKFPEEHMRYGMEDTERAEELLLQERATIEESGDRKAYFDHLQNYPLNEKEAFLSFSGNNFDTVKLNSQLFDIDELINDKYGKFKLEYKTDDNGRIIIPYQVEAIPLKGKELFIIDKNGKKKEPICVYIHKIPLTSYKDLDIAGLDSYDLDTSDTSTSLGSMVVYRRPNNHPGVTGGVPVAMIYCRPDRKEEFYEMCFKLAIHYNLERNVLVDVDKPAVINYFKDKPGGSKYLAVRPRSIESIHSKQKHDFGVKMTGQSKPIMISMLQSWIVDHVHNCWFRDIIMDLLSYDVEQKDNDWDSADALGMALIRDQDMSLGSRKRDNQQHDKRFDMPVYGVRDGNVVITNGTNVDVSDVKDPFLKRLYGGNL